MHRVLLSVVFAALVGGSAACGGGGGSDVTSVPGTAVGTTTTVAWSRPAGRMPEAAPEIFFDARQGRCVADPAWTGNADVDEAELDACTREHTQRQG